MLFIMSTHSNIKWAYRSDYSKLLITNILSVVSCDYSIINYKHTECCYYRILLITNILSVVSSDIIEYY